MDQSSHLKAAKEGNPEAIALMLNRSLNPKGITAKVKLEGDLLRVVLESAEVLNQRALVEYLHKSFLKLNPDGVQSVRVDNFCIGSKLPSWTAQVELKALLTQPALSKSTFPEQSKSVNVKSSNQLEIFIGLIAVVCLLGKCGYDFTHQCDAAKHKLAEAEKQQNEFINRRVSEGGSVTKDDIYTTYGNAREIAIDRENVSKACK